LCWNRNGSYTRTMIDLFRFPFLKTACLCLRPWLKFVPVSLFFLFLSRLFCRFWNNWKPKLLMGFCRKERIWITRQHPTWVMDAATTQSLAASVKSTKMNWGSTQDFRYCANVFCSSKRKRLDTFSITAESVSAPNSLHHKLLTILAQWIQACAFTGLFKK